MADAFDPIAILRLLEERYIGYVLIGDMAEVANGSPLGFDEVEITFPLKDEHLGRLRIAVAGLGGDPTLVEGIEHVAPGTSVVVETSHGPLRLTPLPPGTRGYEDVRRKSTRMHLARGLRAPVADVRDLIRIENAGDADRVRIATLQRIEALDLSRGLGMDR